MKALLVASALAVAAGTGGAPVAAQNHPPNSSTIPVVTLNGAPPVRQPAPGPASRQSAWNTALVGHSDLQGRSAYQPLIISQDGRHIAYVGHHTGRMRNPLTGAVEGNGTSIVDVTNAAKPKYLAHIPGPADGSDEAGGAQMVRVCSGDLLPHAVKGKWYLLRAAGSTAHEIYDVTDGTRPTLLTTVVDGLTGTHKSWWECDTGIAYLVGNNKAEGWRGNHMKIFDLSDPAKPVYIRDFGLPGQQPDAKTFIGTRGGVNIHGPISAGVARNRVYAAYGTGANGVIQILDRKKLLTEFTNALKPTPEELLAPQVGYIVMSPDQGAHTTLPLYGVPIPGFQGHTVLKTRDLMIVASEQGRGEHCKPGPGNNRPAPHFGFLLDITNEATPWPLATFSVPENPGDFCGRGGRFGNHASHESFYPPYYGKLAIFSWFNAGTRIFDIRNPFSVEEVAYFIPAPNKNTMSFCSDGVSHPDGDPKITPACVKVIQTNNVEVDDRGLIYSADRAGTGLHIIRLTGRAARVAAK
jgi:hypothetical protein